MTLPANTVTHQDANSKIDSVKEEPYHSFMKNITVSVKDEVYHRARVMAAERRTSVSALVRRSLEELAGEETEFERLAREERELRGAIRQRFQARDFKDGDTRKLTREELHDRTLLR